MEFLFFLKNAMQVKKVILFYFENKAFCILGLQNQCFTHNQNKIFKMQNKKTK
jgi:hypothetical protein